MNASPSSPNDAAYCAFCGLPLPPALGGSAEGDAVDYCCSGCRVASDVQAATVDEDSRRPLFRLGLGVFFTMNVMVFSMALWSQDFYRAEDFQTPLAQSVRSVFRWGSLLFSAPVLFLLGEPIVAGVWHAMRRRAVTTDLLILLGVAAAYAYSVVSVLRSEGHVYFETGCVVLVFVSLGRLLEARGKRQTSAALDELSRLLPDAVRLVLADGEQREVPRAEVRRGDVLRALPGERLAVDGRIVAGAAAFDEQTVTGESRYAAKRVGDPVYSGTLNVDGDLRIEVTAAAGEETVSRMLALVRDARRAKGRHQRLADAIAAWFVPLVAVIVVVAGTWQGRLHGLDYGILTALAVTLIACPCALGLATPMAVWTALGRAARGQTLFRSGAVLERLATVRAAALDKTGTLTSGEPTVRTALVSRGENRVAALQTVAALAAGSTHALSRAAVGYVGELHRNAPAGCGATGLRTDLAVETLGGRGLVLRDDTGRIEEWLGNERLAREAGATVPDDLIEALVEADAGDATLAYFGWGSHVRGVLVFDEQLRPATRLALTEFRQLGVDPIVLTGDRFARAARIADDLGVAVRAELLPEQKVAALAELRAGVEPDGTVAMIGDGLNDAPALAAADVGIALGCGAELSRDAAGVCLLGDDLRRAAWAIALARRTVRTIRQNLFWAFVYNAGGMALAATGKLAPVWAALAMAASSLIVIGNSLRLSRFPEPEPVEPPQWTASPTPAESESRPATTPAAAPTATQRAAGDLAASALPRP